ncbi:MAG TPA: restriction endonuclease [Candidatus Acidoferrales bacterium]|nr:restriction endonuclease [Candidatus Acidoferrales bacterium]
MNGFSNIVGQEALVRRLRAIVEFSRKHGTPIEHLALIGPQGTGKRTIVKALAGELGVEVHFALARTLERVGDLTGVLTSLEPREILFLEDINQLRQPLREILLPTLKDFRIDLAIGQGPGRRIHPYALQQFTCVCTAERQSDIPADIRNSFGLFLSLDGYSFQELTRIAAVCATQAGLSISDEAARLVAEESKGSPAQIASLVERLKRLGHANITESALAELLDAYGVRNHGHNANSAAPCDSFDDLPGVEFEKLISSALEKMGFRSEITKATGDGGIDIVAVLDRPIIGGRYLIQCKRFGAGNLVNAPTVREFYGAVKADQRAVKGILITTSGFTDQARVFAQDLPLELIDAEALRRLLQQLKTETNSIALASTFRLF